MVIHPDCDIRPLVTAVVERAKEEAARGDDQAREWLLLDGAEWLDMVFDIHPDHTRQWINSNFKPEAIRRAARLPVQFATERA